MQPNFMTDYKRLAAYNALLLDQNKELTERCERLEAALRDARLTMLAASDILEHEYLHPILEADVNDSIERIDTALSTGVAP